MQAEFSVIIPVYNEEETVTDLYGRLIPVMENLCKDLNRPPDSFEVLMVDDGSTDHSLQIIKE
jgi:glycosyltransferase involved in cell wall biosynthesis